MNLFAEFLQVIRGAVREAAAAHGIAVPIDMSRVTAEPPREAAHGDIATNAAMVLNKAFGQPPRVLAEAIAARLRTHSDVADVTVAGPGFINLRLHLGVWPRIVAAVIYGPDAYQFRPAPAAPSPTMAECLRTLIAPSDRGPCLDVEHGPQRWRP